MTPEERQAIDAVIAEMRAEARTVRFCSTQKANWEERAKGYERWADQLALLLVEVHQVTIPVEISDLNNRWNKMTLAEKDKEDHPRVVDTQYGAPLATASEHKLVPAIAGAQFGITLYEYEHEEDRENGMLVQILSEDDGQWHAHGGDFSSWWLRDLINVLETALLALPEQRVIRHQEEEKVLQDQRDIANDILIAVNKALEDTGLSIARATVDDKDTYHLVRVPRVVNDAK